MAETRPGGRAGPCATVPHVMFVAAAILLVSSAAQGTLLVPLTIEDLTRKSDVVVRGTVLAQDARWSPDRHLIYTFVRVRVDETLKGAADAEVMVQRPGGTLGDITQRVHGAPEFADGEQVVLFLARLPSRTPMYVVEGMAQGKLKVEGAAQDALVVQDARAASFVAGGKIAPGTASTFKLKDIVDRIRQTAAKP